MHRYCFFHNSAIGEDKDYPVSELLQPSPNSKGWKSPRFAGFPQTIVLKFPQPVVLRQIQFLSHQSDIATKVELFVYVPNSPLLPSAEQVPTLQFRRIGYLSLDSNERTGFTARELKSVYIQEPAYFLKISLYKCHVNKYNIFNQVGLIAINCHGEPFDLPSEIPRTQSVTQNTGEYDTITSEKLRVLGEAKKRAVEEENFDEAKRIKALMDRLKAVGKDLAALETKKKLAIENEDYEAAKMLKLQIEEVRASALQERRNPQKRAVEIPKGLYGVEDRKNSEAPFMEPKAANARFVAEEIKNEEHSKSPINAEPENDFTQSITIPTLSKKKSEQPQEYAEGPGKEENKEKCVAEPLTEQAKKVAEPYFGLIDVKLLQKLFSKNWLLREAGLNDISHEITTRDFELITIPDDEKLMATLIGFVGHLINDKVTQVSQRAMALIDELIQFYPEKPANHKTLYNTNINECVAALMEKLGDCNPKVRSKAEEMCLRLATEDKIALTAFVMHCTKINKKGAVSAKALQGKLGLLVALFKHFGSASKSLISQSLIEFALNGAKNSNADARNAGYALLIEIYKHIGSKVDGYLDSLRPAQLEVLKAEFAKVGEVAEPADVKGNFKHEAQPSKGRIEEELPSSPTNPQHSEKICEYCGKFDPNFNADTLDIHMFDECPMLYMCPICKNIIEIININSHLLTECTDKSEYTECQECHEAVLKTELEAHEAEGLCRPVKPNSMRCPLCHMDIAPLSIEMWRNHILVKQCPNNERKPI